MGTRRFQGRVSYFFTIKKNQLKQKNYGYYIHDQRGL